MSLPGTVPGSLTEEIKALTGYNCRIVLPLSHDTASAILAIPPADSEICYISLRTWFLMGTLKITADCSKENRLADFTNEGGYDGKINYLTNIMGLCMIQSIHSQRVPDMDYGELCEQASGLSCYINGKSLQDG